MRCQFVDRDTGAKPFFGNGARSFVPIDQRWRSNAVPILLIGIQVLSLSLEMAQSAEICIIACLASMAYLSISYRKEIGRLILLSRENLK